MMQTYWKTTRKTVLLWLWRNDWNNVQYSTLIMLGGIKVEPEDVRDNVGIYQYIDGMFTYQIFLGLVSKILTAVVYTVRY